MKKTYIVAEIGQNHNGDINLAKDLIDDARLARCDAVKINKRDLTCELTDVAYRRVYDSPNAFAETYGEHRHFLELSPEDHKILKKYANNRSLDYLLSVCDIPSLELAIELDCPLIKIPSKEINNLPLLEAAKESGRKIVVSIGLATHEDVSKARETLGNTNVVWVVCTSEYPCEYDNIHLSRLNMQTGYKGFSSHTPDPMLGVAAVAMGAEYIEFHITVDPEMKGTDQIVSLDVNDFSYMVESIRNLEIAFGDCLPWKTLPKFLAPMYIKSRKHKCDDGVYRVQ